MNESLEEQASLYVLDLLEPAEARAFEEQLAANPDLRGEVERLREAAALLAHSAALREPPAQLESQIRQAIRADNVVRAEKNFAPMSWLPWALAAGLAIACVLLALERKETSRHIARLEKRNLIAQMQITTLASKLESAPSANAVVLWDKEKQEGVLKVANVPPNESDRDYQLWIVDPEYKQPVDAGTFHLGSKESARIPFKPKQHVSSADAFAVSLERKGGVEKAEGPMVLLGK